MEVETNGSKIGQNAEETRENKASLLDTTRLVLMILHPLLFRAIAGPQEDSKVWLSYSMNRCIFQLTRTVGVFLGWTGADETGECK